MKKYILFVSIITIILFSNKKNVYASIPVSEDSVVCSWDFEIPDTFPKPNIKKTLTICCEDILANRVCGILDSTGITFYMKKDSYGQSTPVGLHQYQYTLSVSENYTTQGPIAYGQHLTLSSSIGPYVLTKLNIPIFNTLADCTSYIGDGKIPANSGIIQIPEGYVELDDGTLLNINDAPHVLDSTIGTPKNLRLKFIMPKLGDALNTKINISWDQAPGFLHMEMKVKYSYTASSQDTSKSLMFIKYNDNMFASVCQYTTDYSPEGLYTYITSKDSVALTNKSSLLINYIYVRFSQYIETDKSVHYGDWVRVAPVTGGDIATGNVTNTYDEVTTDSNGKDTTIDGGEYNGQQIDGTGAVIPDANTYSNFTDYLNAIPELFTNMFTALFVLFGSIGNFGTLFSGMFTGMSPVLTSMIIGSLGLMIVLGVIKFLKG